MDILVVDDDRDLVDLLGYVLRRAGLRPLPAFDAPAARKLLDEGRPDLVVLGTDGGPGDGLELLEAIRERSDLPVVVLGAAGGEAAAVAALERGADDYLAKPFGHRELVARIRAHLRRRGQGSPPPKPINQPLREGPLTLDPAKHAATHGGARLPLTATEFRLLHCLMTNAGAVVPTRALVKQVWGYDDPGAADVVRATLYRLRRKLADDPARPRLLHTVPGVGVMLDAAAAG